MGFGILYLERAFEMKKEKLFLSMGDNPVELSDIRKVESVLAFTFPDEFKSLYLDCNGGAPSRQCWNEDVDYEPILVESFKPIEAGSRMLDGDNSHLVGFVLSMQEKKVVPSHILPFAVDEANNFICFEKNSGKVLYFAVDVFRPDVEMAVNHLAAQKVLSESFKEFSESLCLDEEEDDEED